ncbi:MAG TPA: hypothetical protein PLD88_02645, partial [Candidatus Berkiella sp.]|nr:hypothetical protein [Candidatus Berkiella sp.]
MTVIENKEAYLKLRNWEQSYEMMQAVSHLNKAYHEMTRTDVRFQQTKKLYQSGIVAKEECLSDERFYKDNQQYYQNAKRQLDQIKEKANATALKLAELKLKQAQNKEAMLQAKAAALIVHSPISGTVLAPHIEGVKQVFSLYPQKPFQEREVVAWLADMSSLCISVKVDEFDIVRLHKGQRAIVSLAAFAAHRLTGNII